VTDLSYHRLLNNGDAKTPNGDFRHFGGLVPRVRLQFSKRRLPEPAYLAIPAGLLLNSGERQFVAKVWLAKQLSNSRRLVNVRWSQGVTFAR
jgi:hypothetical protein